MKAILLAAGRGSRLGTLTQKQPKCFVPFRGQPLIRWQLQALAEAGVRDAAVVRGYLAPFWDGQDLPVARYFTNERWRQSNMVASLACAAPWLEQDICLISYTDIYYTADSIRRLAAADGDIVITYDPNWLQVWSRRFADPLVDAETFRIDASGKLLEIGSRPKSVEEVEGQYMGLLKFTPRGWATVRAYLDSLPGNGIGALDMTGMLSRLIGEGVSIRTVPIAEEWFEFDQVSDLEAAG